MSCNDELEASPPASGPDESLLRVGPGSLMGELVRLYWLPFSRSSDIVAGAPAQPVRLLGEDYLAWRGTRGRVSLIPAQERDPRLAVRCAERNGVVWGYVGSAQRRPELPSLEWNLLPRSRTRVEVCTVDRNWIELLTDDDPIATTSVGPRRCDARETVVGVVRQAAGVTIAVSRHLPGGHFYWQLEQFVLPFYVLAPGAGESPNPVGRALVPRSDHSTLCVGFSYDPAPPAPRPGRGARQAGVRRLPTHNLGRPGEAAARDGRARGPASRLPELRGLTLQRVLDSAARAYRDLGALPASAARPDLCLVRPAGLLLKDGESWADAARRCAEPDPAPGADGPAPRDQAAIKTRSSLI